jgi:signal transduction histidine kinase/DNA-binding response OmpR family regulator
MRKNAFRSMLPWLIGVSVAASLAWLAAAVMLGFAARDDARVLAARQMATQADVLAEKIETDLGLFEFALRQVADPRDMPDAASRPRFPELPLTGRYIRFINVLNEAGDVIADPRSNVSRSVNFAGRDYFHDQVRNTAGGSLIGRPFALAPEQHPMIPISRRLTTPDGGFAGVVVAGVSLDWLADLLARKPPGAEPTVTVRRQDGVVLMRSPFEADAIGRSDAPGDAWREFPHSGAVPLDDGTGGIVLFRRVDNTPLVLELALDRAGVFATARPWLAILPPLALIPGGCALALALFASRARREAARVEARAHADLEQRTRSLVTMSHDLRTPLSAILGEIELLRTSGGLTGPQAERLDRLTSDGAIMRRVVERVTNFARPDDDRARVEVCDLDNLVNACADMVRAAANQKGLALNTNIAAAAPMRLMLPREPLESVLGNLLWNAVRYTNEGSVSVFVSGDPSQLRFEIADTGPGIPERKKSRLFKAYDRLDRDKSGGGGSGLGLWNCADLVGRMQGQIGHRDNPGGGSVFWFEVPAREPDAVTQDPPEETGALAAEAMPRCRVLLVDDLEMTRSVTAEFLRADGHSVSEVPDGALAVDAARAGDFDLILMDMRMPRMNGFETTRRIRALGGEHGVVPIVLLTADLAASGMAASAHAGIDFCLNRPFRRAELREAVARAARMHAAVARGVPDAKPALDADTLNDLRCALGAEIFAVRIAETIQRIDDLIALTLVPDCAGAERAREAAHDLVGISGLVGLADLAACLCDFDTAENRAAAAQAIREVAGEALRALRAIRVEAAVVVKRPA